MPWLACKPFGDIILVLQWFHHQTQHCLSVEFCQYGKFPRQIYLYKQCLVLTLEMKNPYWDAICVISDGNHNCISLRPKSKPDLISRDAGDQQLYLR